MHAFPFYFIGGKNALPIVAIEYDFKSEILLKEAGLERNGIRYGIRKDEFLVKKQI